MVRIGNAMLASVRLEGREDEKRTLLMLAMSRGGPADSVAQPTYAAGIERLTTVVELAPRKGEREEGDVAAFERGGGAPPASGGSNGPPAKRPRHVQRV